jgi:hypothetical protein
MPLDSDSDADSGPLRAWISRSRWESKLSLGTATSRINVRKTNADQANADRRPPRLQNDGKENETINANGTSWADFGNYEADWSPENTQWMDHSSGPPLSKEASGVAQTPSSDVQCTLIDSKELRHESDSKDAVSPAEGKQISGHHCSGFPPCARTFPRAADLAYHRHFHTGHVFGDQRFGRFLCHCGVRFENCTNLLRHEVGMHPGLAITADAIMERMRQDADSTMYDPPLPNFGSTIERLLADVLDQTADPATVLWTIEAETLDATTNVNPSQARKFELEIDLTVPKPTRNTEFECLCYICNRSVHIRRKRDWQKHVLEDLRPYQCVVETCPQSDETFLSAKELLKHYKEWHLHEIRLSKCPFCEVTLKTDLRFQIRHMARHMEEIAFAVVPRPNEEWEFYTSRGSSGREHLQPASMKPRRRNAMSRIPVPTKRRDQVPDPVD